MITTDVWSSFFLFSFDFFTLIGHWDGDPPLIYSSKFIENENKPGDACVTWSGVGLSDSEDVYPKLHRIASFLARLEPSLNFSKKLTKFHTWSNFQRIFHLTFL